MTPLAAILADTESNVIRVLFVVVFLVIWAVSALMSMLAKKKEQERRERVRREIELGRSMPPMQQQMPGQRPPMRPPPQMPRQQQAPRPQQQAPRPAPARAQQQPPKKRFPVKTPVTRRTPTPAVTQEYRPAEIAAQVERAPIITAPPVRRTIAPTAAALSAWLRPSTLRQQFILTEVLQPPLAMREDRT
jgi:hypothetical protein